MDTNEKIQQLCLKLDQIESSSEWLTRSMVNSSNSLAQTATLISVLTEEIREQMIQLVCNLEEEIELAQSYVTKH